MIKKYRSAAVALAIAGAVLLAILFLRGRNIAILNPKGTIADSQRDLMIVSTLLMLVVVLPVFIMTFFIVWKYREGNKKKIKYTPDWDGNRVLELAWWTIPALVITVLGVIIYKSSHALDPFKALASNKKPVTVQVVALQWKWLFIYPEQDIASVNFLQIPEDTPINFEITADAPMNSFWIPQLGGQIYAMAGMTTKLHLMADEPGNYQGGSANLSGEGFSKMKFIAKASTTADFDSWVASIKSSPGKLTKAEYETLAKPTLHKSPALYSQTEKNLLDYVIMKYMKPVAEEGGEDAHNNVSH